MPRLVLALLPWHSGDISTVLSSQAQGHWAVEIQGDSDVARGQSDKTGGPQPGRPCCTTAPQGCGTASPKAGLQGQPGLGTMSAPTLRAVPTARGAPASTGGEANQDEGLGKQRHWQQEPLAYSHVAG